MPESDLSYRPWTLAFLVIGLSLAAGFLTITDYSFWLDELGTHRLAAAQNGTWLSQFLAEPTSDLQMPLYHLYVYGWSQIFGLGETALRMANLPLFVLALATIAWMLRHDWLLAVCATLCVGLHPLAWYYLNDAHPYVMIYAAAAVLMTSVWTLYSTADQELPATHNNHSWIAFCVGVVVLAGANMLAVFWLLPLLVAASMWIWSRRKSAVLTRSDIVALAITALILAALAIFYLYSLEKGVRGTADYETSFASLLFAGYELLGLGGLGPGRLELRESGAAALPAYTVPLALAGSAIVFGVLYGLRLMARVSSRRQIILVLVMLGLPIIFVAVAGFNFHWRVVGRHMMPVAAVVALLFGVGLSGLLRKRSRWRQGVAVILLAAFFFSALSYGQPRHRYEDYRSAGELAIRYSAADHAVWWFASDHGARLYGVTTVLIRKDVRDCRQYGGAGQVVSTSELHPDCLASLNPPNVMISSRRGTHDRHNAIEEILINRAFTRAKSPHGFEAWQSTDTTESRGHRD